MPITRDEIEAALWRWSGWRADQRGVDDILGMVERYADPVRSQAVDGGPACVRETAPADLSALGRTEVTSTVFVDARGTLWVRLEPDPAANGEPLRVCTCCLKPKNLLQYRADTSAPEGRRTQCRDCENAKRRIRTKRKKQDKQGIVE
jgi:hypothetical protein